MTDIDALLVRVTGIQFTFFRTDEEIMIPSQIFSCIRKFANVQMCLAQEILEDDKYYYVVLEDCVIRFSSTGSDVHYAQVGWDSYQAVRQEMIEK